MSRQVLVNLETTHITLSSEELESFMRIEKTYLDNIVRNSLETFAGFTLWKIFGLRGNKAELRKIGSYKAASKYESICSDEEVLRELYELTKNCPSPAP